MEQHPCLLQGFSARRKLSRGGNWRTKYTCSPNLGGPGVYFLPSDTAVIAVGRRLPISLLLLRYGALAGRGQSRLPERGGCAAVLSRVVGDPSDLYQIGASKVVCLV